MTHIHVSRSGGVGVITIDRAARFNSLDIQTAQDFRRAGLQCARDEQVRVVVIRGVPGVFCSGADLKFIRDGGDAGLAYLTDHRRRSERRAHPAYGDVFKQILEYIHSTISEIRRAPKPFIAAVDGVAAAGGFGIAMACDLVVASERAAFEWAYSRTGLTGAESSTFMLPRLVGLRRSMELMLLNRRLTATGSTVGDPRIQAGTVLQIEGVGRQFGGLYRVIQATHTVDSGGYRTSFEARKEIWFGSIPLSAQGATPVRGPT